MVVVGFGVRVDFVVTVAVGDGDGDVTSGVDLFCAGGSTHAKATKIKSGIGSNRISISL